MPVTRFSALFLFLLLAASALAGPEFPVGDAAYGPAPELHSVVSVTTDGAHYLVVWRDGRMGGQVARVMAARVSREGQVLDPLGLRIGEITQGGAGAVWSGSTYLVLWNEGSGSTAQLWARTVDRDGTVSAANLLAENAFLGSVATNGETTVVLYISGLSARALLLDAEGRRTGDVPIGDASKNSGFTVTSNGTEFLVAWSTHDPTGVDVELLRLDEHGTPIGEPLNAGFGSGPRLASDGRDYVLVAQRHHGGEYTWSSRHVAADLSEVTAPVPLPNALYLAQPSLLWNGSEYLFLAEQYPITDGVPFRLTAIRIGQNGRPLQAAMDVEDLEVRGLNPSIHAASNGTTVLGAWVESEEIGYGREARVVARLYHAGSLALAGDELLLSISANQQIAQALAFDGPTAFVVWKEPRGIYGTRVTADGRSRDGRGIELSADPVARSPQVVFDGAHYVAAWTDATGVEIRFITPFGDLREERLHIRNAGSFALIGAGTNTVLAFTDHQYRLWATRIHSDTGTADATPIALSPEGMAASEPAGAWNGRETLIVWNELVLTYFHHAFYEPVRVRGSRLSASFTLIDTAPLIVGDVPDVYDGVPSVAAGGDDWLVTWTANEIRANRVLRNGTLAGPVEGVPLAPGAHSEVVFDGTRFAVAFTNYDALRVGYVPANGPVAFNALVDVFPKATPFAIARGGASVAVAYSRVSDAPEHTGVQRAFLRYLEPVRKVRSVR